MLLRAAIFTRMEAQGWSSTVGARSSAYGSR
jgi:hypothetical protein